jgi:hypothetical protein
MTISSFPGSPRLIKGALVALPNILEFQYNPETLTRSLRAKAATGGSPGEILRLVGPPSETITLDIQLSAVGTPPNSQAASAGIYPQLATLEMLVCPSSARVLANQALAFLGVIEILPPVQSLLVFVWGPRRVVPVRLNDFTIKEELFDPSLNPIQATVTLNLQVLSYDDLGLLSTGGGLSMTQQVLKEAMALSASISSANNLLGVPRG